MAVISPAERALAEEYFAELAVSGEVYPNDIPEEVILRWVKRAKDGGLGCGFLETSSRAALIEVNRQRVYNLFIRHRRSLKGFRVRGIIPAIWGDVDSLKDNGGTVRPRPWVLSAEHPEALESHARTRIHDGIDTALKLHGATLVALGITTWDEIKEDAVNRVVAVCDDMKLRDEAKKAKN